MARSSTKELLTPFKEPEREFRSSRKLFKTLSLDESRSPLDLFSELEENSEEEVTEIMAESMEQYMSKTRADYGSGIARPINDDKYHFKLKGEFLKELRDNTFSGLDHEDANKHIEKVLEIVDLFHVPKITQDEIMLRVFPMSITGAASRWLRNKPSGLIKTWEDLKTKFLSKYCPLARTTKKMKEINNFQQEPDETLYQAWKRFKELLMKCVIPTKKATDAKLAIQEMAKYSQKWHNKTSRTRSTETSDGLAAIQAQLNNLGREIKKVNEKEGDIEQQLQDSTKEIMQILHIKNEAINGRIASIDAAIRNQETSIKTLEIQIGKMRKVLQERGFGSLPSSTETNPRDHVKSISTTVEVDMTLIRHIGYQDERLFRFQVV
ncbi:hypothetical protein Tco_1263119 [Tanacetum coccineum]